MIDKFPIDFFDLQESPIWNEIREIEGEIKRFYIEIEFEESENLIQQCLNARNNMESAKTLLRNLIVLEENQYISEYKENFSWMLDNFGRIDKKLDSIEEETIDKLETIERYNNAKFPHSPKIRRYVNFLIRCIEHLVYYPLKKSLEYFKVKKLDLEDRELFLYWVFVQLYNSSEALGSISAEKIKSFPKHKDISISQPTHRIPNFTKPEEVDITEGEERNPEEIHSLEEIEEILFEDA